MNVPRRGISFITQARLPRGSIVLTWGGDPSSPHAPPDAELAVRARDGDTTAFGLLYERYAPRLYDFLARLVHDSALAEDLTQTTFVQALQRRATLRDPVRVRSWLFSIAHHLALNQLERSPRGEALETHEKLPASEPGPEEVAIAHQAAELVWAAAASLEPRQYAVLDLTVRQGFSTPKVAQVLGLPERHAAVLVHRAREALGNAVRTLLVARRRQDCPRLAELLTDLGVEFTAVQRRRVDHHLRHCEVCRDLADRLTAPAALFGSLPLIPIPSRLLTSGWQHVLDRAGQPAAPADEPPADAPPGAGAAGVPAWPARRRPGRRSVLVAALAAVLIVALVVGILRVVLPFGPATTIRFTRVTQSVSTPLIVTAAVGGATARSAGAGGPAFAALAHARNDVGQIRATRQASSVTALPYGPVSATFASGTRVIFPLLVHNFGGTPLPSPAGRVIYSNNNAVSCVLQTSVTVQPGQTLVQQCADPKQAEPAASWLYNGFSPLLYNGSSPAGGAAPGYAVPPGCGDDTKAVAAARSALQAKLGQQAPAGSVVLYGPVYTFDAHALTCQPSAGTRQTTSFTYTQYLSGGATQVSYAPADAKAFQLGQLRRVAAALPGSFALVSAQICPTGPQVVAASADGATLACAAAGIAAWNWNRTALHSLAAGLAGLTPPAAAALLNTTAGIVPGSASISLARGTTLPGDPDAVEFIISP